MTAADFLADLRAFLDAGPSPYHVVDEALRRLTRAGFEQVDPSSSWPGGGGRRVAVLDGALVAVDDREAPPTSGLRIIGAHTDSPGFRLKPRPDHQAGQWRQLATEIYGGPLLNSWLDRDLGLAGRVAVRVGGDVELRLVRDDRPLLKIPQLAIHLDREVNERGLKLDKQRHLTPVWGIGAGADLRSFLAEHLRVEPDALLAHDLMPFDLQPAAQVGIAGELLSSARLDNLVSCHAGLHALSSPTDPTGTVRVLALFDHEEVGSTSARGADGAWLAHLLERTLLARGGDRRDWLTALARTTCLSADMAHATHPNFPERHDPGHLVEVNAGPVLKVNAQQRYSTDADTGGRFAARCADAGVPLQHFVSRNDLPCGSTIGPLAAARLGVPTVDVGVAQLGMHSVRETCGAHDPEPFARVLQLFLASA